MARRTKVLLWLSVITLVVGGVLNVDAIHPFDAAWLYVIFPVGAVFLGLALISRLLEKETPVFDEDQKAAFEGRSAPSDKS